MKHPASGPGSLETEPCSCRPVFSERLFPPLSLAKEVQPEFSPYCMGRKLEKNNPGGRAICQTSSFIGTSLI